ncbi:MAG TPA: hypothetical protein VG434_07985 [Sphingomicrobium sp.]|nr:hypothetical protein [Sphingomicrobium sp.]
MKPNSATVVSGFEKAVWPAFDGFVSVTDYRLYALDGVDKVASGEWFEAEDDDSAIEAAKTLMDGHDCELWQGKRLVTRILHKRGN